jgi:hypothetical protein
VEKIIDLYRKHFMLRLVATVGLCVLAAVVIGSGLRGNTTTSSVVPVDLDQPARLAVQPPATQNQSSNTGQSIAASSKSSTTTTNSVGSGSSSPANNTNVSSLSQAIKILATKPVETEGDKNVATTNTTNAASVKTGGQVAVPQPEAAIASTSNNSTGSSQTKSGAAKGR